MQRCPKIRSREQEYREYSRFCVDVKMELGLEHVVNSRLYGIIQNSRTPVKRTAAKGKGFGVVLTLSPATAVFLDR